jgi:plasmid stabilization system protein ParE
MARRLIWAIEAAEDLQSTARFIETDSPDAAKRLVQQILRATRGLLDFPMRGRIFSEADSPDIREPVYQKYRIVYSLRDPERVTVLAVKRGSVDMTAVARRRGWLRGWLIE